MYVPLVLDVGEVEWYTWGFSNLGVDFDLKWISCMNIMSAFMLYMLAKICDLFTGILRPLAYLE